MAIRGVFFDLGGTLRICDADEPHQARARARMARLAGRDDPEAFLELVNRRYAPYREWALAECREAGDYDLWHDWLLPEMPEDALRPIAGELTWLYRQVKGKRRLVEGGLEVLYGLKARGFKLGIISNLIGETEIQDWLREDGLAPLFDAVILSSVTRIRKPDPRMYFMGCEALGLPPSACANVADNLKRDFTGAKAAGIGANVLFISQEKLKTKTITEENRPDYIVHRFTDILDLPILKGGGGDS